MNTWRFIYQYFITKEKNILSEGNLIIFMLSYFKIYLFIKRRIIIIKK